MVFPLDVIRRQMQVGGVGGRAAVVSDLTWLSGLRAVLQKQGVRGAFAGISPTYAKVIPSVMIAKTAQDALVSFGVLHGFR